MTAGLRAQDLFSSGYFCAEAVLQALAEKLGMDSELVPRMASGFCSGVSRTNGPCGAVTGAIMGLGLAFGRSMPDKSDQSREEMMACYSFSQEFLARFTDRFSTTSCQELSGCDFSTSAGQQKFRDENIIEQCAVFVREAADMAAAIMDEELGDVEEDEIKSDKVE